ncbi:hypothetical protein ACFLYO_10515 [Chloroflexota bacterium]
MPQLNNIDTRRLGKYMIWAGVAVWIPYFLLKFAGMHPPVMAFLPFHLCGVIPGAILNRWSQIRGLFERWRSDEAGA